MKRKYFIISLIGIIGISVVFFCYQPILNYWSRFFQRILLPSPSVNFEKEIRFIEKRKIKPLPSTNSEPAINEPENVKLLEVVSLDVPFTSQAPFLDWSEPYQNACEEANIIMAMHWVRNTSLSKDETKKEILSLVEFQTKNYGYYENTSTIDTAELLKQFYQYDKVEIKNNPNLDDIKKELTFSRIVIVPVNGQLLNNPYYTPPGPLHHMILIKGYDEKTQEFITNDAGTRHGQNYRFSYETLLKAINDYPSGHHLNRYQETRTILISNMIIIRK